MVNNSSIYRGAIPVSLPVANYLSFRENLTQNEALPLDRCSPVALFLQSHLQVEAQYNSARIIPELTDLYPNRIYYTVSGKLYQQGYWFLPDEAVVAFNHFMLTFLADDLAVFGKVLRPMKVRLKDVTDAIHRQVWPNDEYQYESYQKRELRLREERGDVYVVHRPHSHRQRFPTTHRVNKSAANTDVMLTLF